MTRSDSNPSTRFDAFVNLALAAADYHEREARGFRELAEKVLHPPAGTRVEAHYTGAAVTFVTEITE